MATFIRTFTNVAGETWRYDFDLTTFEQVALAQSAFNYEFQQLNRPARSLRELELSGRMEYLLKGMAYLLVRVRTETLPGDNGETLERVTVEPWSRRTSHEACLEFLRRLPAAQWSALEEAKQDFFTKVNIVDLALLGQLSPFIESAMATASTPTTRPDEPTNSGSWTSERGDTTTPESMSESAARS